jgi:hypothetical protein
MPVPGPSKAQSKLEARGEARIARLHLFGLFSGGVVVMAIALVAVVVLAVVAVLSHH